MGGGSSRLGASSAIVQDWLGRIHEGLKLKAFTSDQLGKNTTCMCLDSCTALNPHDRQTSWRSQLPQLHQGIVMSASSEKTVGWVVREIGKRATAHVADSAVSLDRYEEYYLLGSQ